MKVLILFVEITSYNIARIRNVYEKHEDISCDYVYCNESISGHKTRETLPVNARILSGNTVNKLRQLVSILRSKKYDFIEINGYADSLRFFLIQYAKLNKIAYAIETDTQLLIPNNLIKRLLKYMYLKYIFHGKHAYGFAGGTRQKYLFEYYGMLKDNIHVLPMTVDLQQFLSVAKKHDKSYYKEKYGFENKRVILYVGRFESVKNVQLLLSAFHEISKKNSDVSCLLIGKGTLQSKLQQQCEEKRINNVYFENYKLLPDLAEYYCLADVFVLPSDFEPWGLVVNESLACFTPVIASDKVGSVDDLIQNGLNGEVFEAGNVQELIEKLEFWLNHRTCEKDFDINERWNHRTYMKIWEQVLQEVCSD
ncbi:glycosyltransferase family 4 protein [Massilimicrobiota sp. An134]|uniref:glycosyltransferase family 4 protein n=1 Tax=Massilimicrobiota sp. An134 TaxID=1965557 RepID=UPI0013021C07|nr:glycosyltransferase family 4 protein [Massilimicrobiota sp. An134]